MSSLEAHIRQLSADGLRIHIWPTKGGEFQANASEQGISGGWTCHTAPDPIEALTVVLRLRATGASGRDVIIEGKPGYVDAMNEVAIDATTPVQIDLEEAIAAADTDDFEDLL